MIQRITKHEHDMMETTTTPTALFDADGGRGRIPLFVHPDNPDAILWVWIVKDGDGYLIGHDRDAQPTDAEVAAGMAVEHWVGYRDAQRINEVIEFTEVKGMQA